MQQTLTYPAGPRRPGLAIGLAASVLLHVLLLAVWRTPSVAPQQEARRWTEPLTVRLLPPPPKPVSTPVAKPILREEPADRPKATPRRPDRPVMTAPPQGEPAPITAVPAPPPDWEKDSAPRFDLDAARSAARGMANDLKVPGKNWAAEKLNEGKEWQATRDEKLGGQVAGAARPDCRTAHAGAGLLAPLYMLMDKKDSGCKF